ncbi:uncharacterized protein BYT42DRAFT_553775, partial [Radiomyces spectabilis]|uniref:uncharacterized protein n=1 Tax=Radiomyces spectabilis TaxID=64574 RepID=UPI00221F765D
MVSLKQKVKKNLHTKLLILLSVFVTQTNFASSDASASEETCTWRIYDADQWNACPIGCLPDGKIPVLDLPMTEQQVSR